MPEVIRTTKATKCGIGVYGCDKEGRPIREVCDIDSVPDGSLFGHVVLELSKSFIVLRQKDYITVVSTEIK